MPIRPAIEVTDDGSPTLRHPLSGESYHSTHGAVSESEHVFIGNGLDLCPLHAVRIFEMGFGSGLNAYLTLKAAMREGREVDYTAVELHPVDIGVARLMDYACDPLFVAMHEAPWNVGVEIAPGFTLRKIEGDLEELDLELTFDLVYFDAFSPTCQPELWTAEVFAGIYRRLAPGGALVTYSAKGEVKRALRQAGFEVRRLAGAPGKRHMLRALKQA